MNTGNNSRSRAKRDPLFVAAGLLLLAVGTVLAALDRLAVASLVLTVAVVVILIANLERIEFFKGFGIEAKTRAIDDKIKEAEEVLHNVRNLTLIAGTNLIELLNRTGRWDSHVGARRAYEATEEIKEQLRAVGLTSADIQRAAEPWIRFTARDLFSHIVNGVASEVQRLKKYANDEQRIAVEQFEALLNGKPRLPSPNELLERAQTMLKSAPLVAPEIRDRLRTEAQPWMAELRYLSDHGELPKTSLLLAEEQ